MPSTTDADRPAADTHFAELLVKWQQPSTRALQPIAILSFDGGEYRFRYLPSAGELEGFRPLLGFPDLTKQYVSQDLFPLFNERVLDPSRPDYDRYIAELDLDREVATPWELLTRSGGESAGDTLQVQPFPRPTTSGWACRAMVAGVRYLAMKTVDLGTSQSGGYSPEELESILAALQPDDQLDIVREVGNTWDSAASLLVTLRGDAVGYLPNWLARLLAPLTGTGGQHCRARVERVNPSDAGWHLRMLVDVQADEDYEVAYRRLVDGAVLG